MEVKFEAIPFKHGNSYAVRVGKKQLNKLNVKFGDCKENTDSINVTISSIGLSEEKIKSEIKVAEKRKGSIADRACEVLKNGTLKDKELAAAVGVSVYDLVVAIKDDERMVKDLMDGTYSIKEI